MWVLDRLRGPKEGVPFPILVHPHQQNRTGIYVNLEEPRSSALAVNLKCMRLAARRRTHEYHVVASHDDCSDLLCIVRVRDVISVLEDEVHVLIVTVEFSPHSAAAFKFDQDDLA